MDVERILSERLLSKRRPALAGLVLLVLIGVGLYAWRMGSRLRELSLLGYPGIFILMVVSGGSYFPVPGPPAVALAGSIWNPLLVGLAAGLGNATGEMLSYLLGRSASTALQNYRDARFVALMEKLLSRYGFLTIFVLAAVPNPTFHVLTLLAGSLGYPARYYWLACAAGNVIKYGAMAYVGHHVAWLLG